MINDMPGFPNLSTTLLASENLTKDFSEGQAALLYVLLSMMKEDKVNCLNWRVISGDGICMMFRLFLH